MVTRRFLRIAVGIAALLFGGPIACGGGGNDYGTAQPFTLGGKSASVEDMSVEPQAMTQDQVAAWQGLPGWLKVRVNLRCKSFSMELPNTPGGNAAFIPSGIRVGGGDLAYDLTFVPSLTTDPVRGDGSKTITRLTIQDESAHLYSFTCGANGWVVPTRPLSEYDMRRLGHYFVLLDASEERILFGPNKTLWQIYDRDGVPYDDDLLPNGQQSLKTRHIFTN